MGYNQENIILFGQDAGIADRSETFLNEVRNIPSVASAASTNHGLLGRQGGNPDVKWEGKESEERILFERFFVDYEFFETIEFEMNEGRWFDRDFTSDSTKLIINEAAAEAMGFSADEVMGKRIQLYGSSYFDIIGVVKDFHYMSVHQPVGPAYLRLEDIGIALVRLKEGREREALQDIEAVYQKFAPGYTFSYSFLDQSYQALYESEKRIGELSSYFASFAIIISCLGLFGLASFTAERRIKEIGIRKVLGASTSEIILMLSTDFMRLVLVAIILALPISYFLMQDWLSQFAYKIDLSTWIFLSAAIVSLMIAWLTVSSQAFKAANVNPVNSLQNE